jgi:hypothetical protein
MLQKFLLIQQNVRLYHWTTDVYTQHVVSGELYEKLDKLFDKFIETYQGEEERIKFKKISVESVSLSLDELLHELKKYKRYFMTLKLKQDLSNIRDEIVAEIHKYMFLLRLK